MKKLNSIGNLDEAVNYAIEDASLNGVALTVHGSKGVYVTDPFWGMAATELNGTPVLGYEMTKVDETAFKSPAQRAYDAVAGGIRKVFGLPEPKAVDLDVSTAKAYTE